MKRFLLSLIILSTLLFLVGCIPFGMPPERGNAPPPSDTQIAPAPEPEPAPTPEPDIDPPDLSPPTLSGFVEYNNPGAGFTLQYPIAWFLIDDGISEADVRDAINEVFGEEVPNMLEDLGADFSSTLVYWYDFENSTDYFTPNVNLSADDSGGLTQNDLKSPAIQEELQAAFDELYPLLFGGYTMVEELQGRALGENYFALFKFTADINQIHAGFYQAITEHNGVLYTFSLTTFDYLLNSTAPAFEQMLSTLRFN